MAFRRWAKVDLEKAGENRARGGSLQSSASSHNWEVICSACCRWISQLTACCAFSCEIHLLFAIWAISCGLMQLLLMVLVQRFRAIWLQGNSNHTGFAGWIAPRQCASQLLVAYHHSQEEQALLTLVVWGLSGRSRPHG